MKKNILWTLIFLVIASCSFSTATRENLTKQELFIYQYKNFSLNKDFEITYLPDEFHPLKIGNSFFILFQNKSKNVIKIDVDKDLKILIYENNEWRVIDNRVKYLWGSNMIVLDNDATSPVDDIQSVVINPAVSNEGKPVDIRVVVTGEKTGILFHKHIGAYIDLILSP